jgi:hypothetical protein
MHINLTYDPVRVDLVHDKERSFTGRISRNAKGEFFIAPFNVEKFQKMPDSKYAYYLNRIAQIVQHERPDLVQKTDLVAA